jgi:hypothetical protein
MAAVDLCTFNHGVGIYIRLIASGIDKIHNCPKCLKEKHFQNLMHMSETFDCFLLL